MDRRTFIGGVAGGLLVVPFVARAQATRADDVPRAASFAYVANNGAGTVSAFRMDAATGALIPLAPTAIASDTNPYTVTVDAAGRRLYVAHGDASSIVTFSIDPTSGALRPAPISRTATGAYPVSAAIDPLRMPAVLASASRPS